MSPTRPTNASLFRFTFAHLPEPASKTDPMSAPPFAPEQSLKIFGFFDILRVEELRADTNRHHSESPPPPALDPEQVSGDRQQRTLLAFGQGTLVNELIARGRNHEQPAYVAICLVKLAAPAAHSGYHNFVEKVLEWNEENTAYLACLDAPDLIILRSFGGKDDTKPKPLERLIEWMEVQFRSGNLAGNVERSLTMVAFFPT